MMYFDRLQVGFSYNSHYTQPSICHTVKFITNDKMIYSDNTFLSTTLESLTWKSTLHSVIDEHNTKTASGKEAVCMPLKWQTHWQRVYTLHSRSMWSTANNMSTLVTVWTQGVHQGISWLCVLPEECPPETARICNNLAGGRERLVFLFFQYICTRNMVTCSSSSSNSVETILFLCWKDSNVFKPNTCRSRI